MTKKDYQVMPNLTEEEYKQLKADIAERGVMVPIEFDENGNCIDGHHRLKACEELGIKDYPKVIRVGMDKDEAVDHALRENLIRRHLTTDEKRKVIQWILKNHDMPNAEIAKIVCVSLPVVIEERKKWNDARSDLKNLDVDTTQGTDGKSYPVYPDRQREAVNKTLAEHPEKPDRQIARETGASPTTVGTLRKKMVSVFNPSKRDEEALKNTDIQRRLAENEKMTVAGAIREEKRDRLVEQLEDIKTKEAKAAEGVYDVVVIDPPWPTQKVEREVRPNQVEYDYPTMSLEEIKGTKIPAADDCHVFLWATQKYLPDAFDVLKAWDARYVCTFVWHKTNGGYKPLDLPIYNCEFCLYARIGTPKFVDDHNFKTCFETTITGHSKKPEEFYETLRRVTAGRRLDMFRRRAIKGFDSWGKEAENNV